MERKVRFRCESSGMFIVTDGETFQSGSTSLIEALRMFQDALNNIQQQFRLEAYKEVKLTQPPVRIVGTRKDLVRIV